MLQQLRRAQGLRAHLPPMLAALLWLLLIAAVDQARATAWGWIALVASVVAVGAARRGRFVRPSRAVEAAATASVALAILALASASWARYAPSFAWREGALGLTYTMVGIAVWSLVRDGEDLRRWCAWFAATSVVVAVAQVGSILLASPATSFDRGRLVWPIDYSNAGGLVAVLGLVAILMLDGEVSRAGRPWPASLRSGCAVGLLAGTMMLSQSRGAIVAAVCAVAIGIVVVGRGLPRSVVFARCISIVGSVIVCWGMLQAAFLGWQVAFQHATVGGPIAVPRSNATESGFGVLLLALLVGGGFVVSDLAVPRLAGRWSDAGRSATAARFAIVAVLAALLVGGGVAWGSGQMRACVNAQPPQMSVGEVDAHRVKGGAHLFQEGSARCRYWGVAAHVLQREPWSGVGFGNFGLEYATVDAAFELPVYAHSQLAEVASGGGVPALLLFGVIVTCALIGVRRALSVLHVAPALCVGVAWGVASLIDFTWEIPAVTLPGLALTIAMIRIGNASTDRPARRTSIAIVFVSIITLVATVPLVIAGTLENAAHAVDAITASPEQRRVAERRAAAAARWNPLASDPLLILARLRMADGDVRGAADAAREAIDREPNRWTTLVSAARVLDDAGVREQSRRAMDAAGRLDRQLSANSD